MTLMEQAATLGDSFERHYGESSRWIAAAPGRVNLIGEHTDYNDGFVLPMAINRYTLIAAAPSGTNFITIRSNSTGNTAIIDLSLPIEPVAQSRWENYPRGVIAGFQKRGHRLQGFNALIHSTVPLGAGVSSSAALLVAIATAMEAMAGDGLDPLQKTLLCQKAEHEFAGVPSGIMDPCISILGREDHALLLDCRSYQTQWIPVSDGTVSVLIINTNVKHDLASGEYSQRRAQCAAAARALGMKSLRDVTREQLEDGKGAMDSTALRRALHVVSEIERTLQASECLKRRMWAEAGRLMYASHESLKNDYEVSCRELDAVVEIARAIGYQGGVYGCRMTGGGFGGCAVALVRTDALNDAKQAITEEYRNQTGITPTLFASRAAAGAHLIAC